MSLDLQHLLAALPSEEETAPPDAVSLGATTIVPTGALRRLWTLGTMQGQIAAAYLAAWIRGWFGDREQHLADAHAASAIRLLGGMTYLRGAVMKVGQALANYPNIVPDAFVSVLNRLHFDAPPMHFALVRDHIENELGGDIDTLFASFDERAFAAASLGQVHRAVLQSGEVAAVKVQYPGIATAIRNDLRNGAALLAPMRITRDWEFIRAQFDELREMLTSETDYVREADMIERAQTYFTAEEGIRLPRVFRSLSTSRVLAMEHLDGRHVDAFLASSPSQVTRDAFGAKVYLATLRLYYRARMNYSDPHPGNYLMMDDGTLGVLDFGCVRLFQEDEVRLLAASERAFHGGREELRAFYAAFCSLTPDQLRDEERMNLLEQWYRWLVEPLLVRPFDFSDATHLKLGFDLLARLLRGRYTQSHPVQLYVTRTILGLRAMLYRLGARVDVRAIHERELSEAQWIS
jgi:predicted unusual protein kinase regulating ubiquinone biosynthesis (AarF/ABC1/UbiB family)